MEKACSYWLQGDQGGRGGEREREKGRERKSEREDKYRPPRSINHILLCNFTLTYAHVHTQPHKVEWVHC